jgi:hypothetical protein
MRLPVLIVVLAWAWLAQAQGTFHFDWHGNQNQVQGGFNVTIDELYGSAPWGSPVLLKSLSFTDFFGVTMSPSQNPYSIYGGDNSAGWFFRMTLTDFGRGMVLHVSGDESMILDRIVETDLGGMPLGEEWGNWSCYSVPEPKTTALFGLGLACLMVRRRRGPTPSLRHRTW